LINISGLRTPSGTRAIRDPEGQAARTNPSERDPGAGRGLPADWLDKIQDPRDLAAYEMLRDVLGFDVADATLSAFPGRSGPDNMLPSVILTKEVETYPQKRVVDDYAYEYLENKTIVEVDYSVNYINNLTQIQVLEQNPGLFFVNYSIQPNNLSVYSYQGNYNADVRMSIRVQDEAGKTVVQHIRDFPIRLKKNQINSIGQRPFRLNDSFPLVPGQYKISLLWENTGSKEFTSVEKDILVPEPEWLIMSPLILSRRMSTHPDKDASIRSFQVGNLQFYPALLRKFSQADSLHLFFQIFGLTDELKEKGEIEYALYKKDRKIPLLSKKASDWENDRNIFQEFALEKFPPGDYKITASLLSDNEQVLSDTQEFSISEMEIPDPWIMSQPNPVRGNPIYYYIKGNQYLNKGELNKARAELEKACFIIPDSLDFALSYAKILMVSKEYRMSKGILMPFVEAKKKDFDLFYFIAKSSHEMGQLEEAIDYYHRALSQKGRIFEILNAIGDCHLELGEKDKAVEAWERSLKEKPDQEKIKTLIKKHKIKKNDSGTNFIY
jgi:tetratricopeptide (TPR) repeat protein